MASLNELIAEIEGDMGLWIGAGRCGSEDIRIQRRMYRDRDGKRCSSPSSRRHCSKEARI